MEDRAGTLFVEIALLLDRYREQLNRVREIGERALSGLDATQIISASFDVQSLTQNLATVEGLITQAATTYNEQAVVEIRANVQALAGDLSEARGIIVQAIADLRSTADVPIGADLTPFSNDSQRVADEARRIVCLLYTSDAADE